MNSGSTSSEKVQTNNKITTPTVKAAGEPTKLSQAAIFKASTTVKKFVDKNGRLPNSVTISGIKFSMAEYLYLISKAIALKNSKSSSSVNIKWNVADPIKPSGSTVKKTISKGNYVDWAKRTYKFIDKNNVAPNFINSKFGKVQYQTLIFGFAKIGDFLSSKKMVPKTITLSVTKNSKLNKNMPTFSRVFQNNKQNTTNNFKVGADKNAIWLHSWDMGKVNFSLLKSSGINNIFLHENAFKNRVNAINWINQVTSKGFKVHVWFTTFFNATSKKWTNPIVNGKLNQAYFNKVISRAKSYAAIEGVVGIHLDYIRYPGHVYNRASIFKYSGGNGANAITEFVRQLSVATKKENSEIILSAAIMPEKQQAARSHGQDAPRLAKNLDVLIPMLYKGNYKASTAWIQSTTKWYTDNCKEAEIWGGIYGYHSDRNPTRLSVSALTKDCKATLNGGATGIVIFRWGTVSLFNLLGIK